MIRQQKGATANNTKYYQLIPFTFNGNLITLIEIDEGLRQFLFQSGAFTSSDNFIISLRTGVPRHFAFIHVLNYSKNIISTDAYSVVDKINELAANKNYNISPLVIGNEFISMLDEYQETILWDAFSESDDITIIWDG